MMAKCRQWWLAVALLSAGCAGLVGIDGDYVVGSPDGTAGLGATAGSGITGGSGGAESGGGSGGTVVTGGSGGAGGAGGVGAAGGTTATGGQGGSGGTPLCFPTDLLDPFDGSFVNTTLWRLQGATSIISVHSGMLHFAPQAQVSLDQWAGVVTRATYDVRDCQVWIEVPSLVNGGSPGSTYFQLHHADGSVAIAVHDGTAAFRVNEGGNQDETLASYDSAAHRWWRIREDSGTIYLETAPDGQTWTVQNSATSPSYVDDVVVGIGVVPPEQAVNPGEAQFDNFDVEP